jgi:MoxR-like ATPase
LGDHLAETHEIGLTEYLVSFPGADTVSQECLDVFEAEKKDHIRRVGPPVHENLAIQILDLPAPVNVNWDVPEAVCLPMVPHFLFPTHGELSVDVLEAIIAFLCGRDVYVWGMPGSGKDALFHALCWMLRRPSAMYQVRPGTDVESWLFTQELIDGETVWTEGPLFKQLTEGYLTASGRRIPYTILITDLDRADEDQAEILRLILDTTKGRVPGPRGIVKDMFPGTQIVMTGNTAGGGDERGRMVSAQIMDASILDRFDRVFEFHWMDWADEGQIVRAKFPLLVERVPDLFKQVGAATASIRKSIHSKKVYAEFSHRGLCSWLGHCEDIIRMTGNVPQDLAERGARAFLDKMPDPTTRLAVKRLIDPHIKGGVLDKGKGKDKRSSSTSPLGGFK